MTFITIYFLLLMHGIVITGRDLVIMQESYTRTGVIPYACIVKDDPRFPKEYTKCAPTHSIPKGLLRRSWKFMDQ